MIPLLTILTIALAPQEPTAPAQQAPSQGSAVGVVSKMFGYYAGAKSMSGTIHMTQAAEGKSLTLDTTIAYEAPSKLYIKQVRNSNDPGSWLVTSDGQVFSYDKPKTSEYVPQQGRLLEPVSPSPGIFQDYHDIYRASLLSLGENDVPEKIAIAGRKELEEIRDCIGEVALANDQKLGNETVHVVNGTWRIQPDPRVPPTARFQMFITDDGQLRRFARTEYFSTKVNGVDTTPIEIITVWDLHLAKDAKPDETLFTVVR